MLGKITLVDATGCLAAIATITAFGCHRMFKLRLAAIMANVLFIIYAATLGLLPVLVLHCILLPMNVLRLRNCLREMKISQVA